MSANIPASVTTRLLRKAKERGEQFEFFLVRYACERFLYRVGASALRDRWILKGAGLLTLWLRDPYRQTRDLDMLAFGPADEASIRAAVAAVCNLACPEDGLRFDVESLDVSPIRAEMDYPGQRAVLRAYLGPARIRMQVDFGFGDAIVPGPEDATYPTLLDDLPPPWLRTYPREVTVAEKFHAMVGLGRANSRMKDFHDIWALSSELAFEGPPLRQAVGACFERRATQWTTENPDALGSAFYSSTDLVTRWGDYLRNGAFRAPPPASFESIGDRVRAFLGPVRGSLVAGQPFDMHCAAGGPWR